jgi:hypothetical protein
MHNSNKFWSAVNDAARHAINENVGDAISELVFCAFEKDARINITANVYFPVSDVVRTATSYAVHEHLEKRSK